MKNFSKKLKKYKKLLKILKNKIKKFFIKNKKI